MGQEEVIPSEERAYTNGPDLVGRNKQCLSLTGGFPDSSVGKESACNAGDPGSIPRSGRPAGEEIGYPLQYSCLENSIDRVAWWATFHGVMKSQTLVSDLGTFRKGGAIYIKFK